MNVRFQIAALFAASILVAGCEQKTTTATAPAPSPAPAVTPAEAPPAPVSEPTAPQQATLTGFKHDASLELFGYYIPEGQVKFGKWVLAQLHIGTPADLARYERGDRDPPQYAPVLIELYDETSAESVNELGGTSHANERRVLPLAYEVTANSVSFRGKDAELGDVSFTGTLDSAAVTRLAAGAGMGSAEAPIVLTGKLTVGSDTRDVKFTWFGGD